MYFKEAPNLLDPTAWSLWVEQNTTNIARHWIKVYCTTCKHEVNAIELQNRDQDGVWLNLACGHAEPLKLEEVKRKT